MALNYFEHVLVFVSVLSGCASISASASLVGVPEGVAISTMRIKICAISQSSRKIYKSMIKQCC